MAHIFVKNSLSELKAAMVDINFVKSVTTSSKGDNIYLLTAGTTYPTNSGSGVSLTYIDKVSDYTNLDYAVDTVVSKIASQIDWLPLSLDTESPHIEGYGPVGSTASIASNIYIEVRDDMPSAGIDLSNMQVILSTEGSSFDITDECVVNGDPLFYKIFWSPPIRVQQLYREEK